MKENVFVIWMIGLYELKDFFEKYIWRVLENNIGELLIDLVFVSGVLWEKGDEVFDCGFIKDIKGEFI